MVTLPKIWEIIERFKGRCRSEGWETADHEDLVKGGEEHCNFLWVREIYPSTFKSVAKKGRSAVREGTAYRVVKVSHKAWICTKAPSKSLKHLLAENPELLRRKAIYDMSQCTNGVCKILNETESVVFQEFERFLKRELALKLQPIQIPVLTARPSGFQEAHAT